VSPLAWLITFGVIGLLSVVGLLGIGWYARRAMEEHQRQVKEILTEMQQVMEEETSGELEPRAGEDPDASGPGDSGASTPEDPDASDTGDRSA